MQRDHWNGPVARAIWFIESHLDDDIALDDIADACGVSTLSVLLALSPACR